MSGLSTLLTGDIKNIIGAAFNDLFRSAVIERDTQITTNPASPDADAQDWAPEVTGTTTYTCKAIYETYSKYMMANNMVQANDRKIMILAASLSTNPAIGDRIILDSLTFVIPAGGKIEIDPAGAVWEVQGRIGEA
jgi:hypothetical protein